MIRALLIDDEVHGLDALTILLRDHCPDVEIVDRCQSGKEAIEKIRAEKPNVVFLDIEMPGMNGFEFLEQFAEVPFAVIFTTSYDRYAIKAIRYSALDYLLKPIDAAELKAAVRRAASMRAFATREQLQMLSEHMRGNETKFTRIAIPTANGYELVGADQIVRCEADDNYTLLFLKNHTKMIACRTLKEMEQQLSGFDYFLRVHHSYIVNLNEVSQYIRGEGGYLIMSDQASVNVSRSRKDDLLARLTPKR